MKLILNTYLKNIHAGESLCPFDQTCQNVTVLLLNSCSMDQLHNVNIIFKTTLTNEDLIGADDEAKKAAMINAILNSNF